MQVRDVTKVRQATDRREELLQGTLSAIETFLRRRMRLADFGNVSIDLAWRDGAMDSLRLVDPTQTFRVADLVSSLQGDAAGNDELRQPA